MLAIQHAHLESGACSFAHFSALLCSFTSSAVCLCGRLHFTHARVSQLDSIVLRYCCLEQRRVRYMCHGTGHSQCACLGAALQRALLCQRTSKSFVRVVYLLFIWMSADMMPSVCCTEETKERKKSITNENTVFTRVVNSLFFPENSGGAHPLRTPRLMIITVPSRAGRLLWCILHPPTRHKCGMPIAELQRMPSPRQRRVPSTLLHRTRTETVLNSTLAVHLLVGLAATDYSWWFFFFQAL